MERSHRDGSRGGCSLVQRLAVVLCGAYLAFHLSHGVEWKKWKSLLPIKADRDGNKAAPLAFPAPNAKTPPAAAKPPPPAAHPNETMHILVRPAWSFVVGTRPGLNNQLVAFAQMLRYLCHPNMKKLVTVESGAYAGTWPRVTIVMPSLVSSGPYSKSEGNPMPSVPQWATRGKPGDIARYLNITGVTRDGDGPMHCGLVYNNEPLWLLHHAKAKDNSDEAIKREKAAPLRRVRCHKCHSYNDAQRLRMHLLDGNSSIYTNVESVTVDDGEPAPRGGGVLRSTSERAQDLARSGASKGKFPGDPSWQRRHCVLNASEAFSNEPSKSKTSAFLYAVLLKVSTVP